jgi:DNA replication and repair protein RecF
MQINRLSLTNFRNFARLDMDIPRRAVLLVGSNAQGKTSLLEAIYFLAAFTSFQTHADRQMINFIAARESLAVGRLIAEYTRGGVNHRLEARLILEDTGPLGKRLRKEVLLDGVKKPISEAIGHFNAVLFVPQMSHILEGAPEDRRRYINLACAQAIPAYARTISEYHKMLDQRNALLKMLHERGGDQSQLDVWDEPLARLGAQLIEWRIHALQELEKLAARTQHRLTRGREVLRISYQPAFDPLPKPNGQIALRIETPVDRSGLSLQQIEDGFRARLRQIRAEEIARGVTTIGPHRDEARFLANGIDLSDYGSRGQIRTALLALKLAEVAWMKERTGQWPVILLDEVMAELDMDRRADLLNALDESEQVLFTTTDLKLFAPGFVEKSAVWTVENGTVRVNS